MAPEKAKQEQEDFRSDLYSLGATLFHVLAGRAPFEAETGEDVIELALRDPTPELSEFRRDVPSDFCGIVYRILQDEGARRVSDR